MGWREEEETGRSGTAAPRRVPRATRGRRHRRHKQRGGRILPGPAPTAKKPRGYTTDRDTKGTHRHSRERHLVPRSLL